MKLFVKKTLSIILCIIMICSAIVGAFAVDVNIGGNTQTHVVSDYEAAYSAMKDNYLRGNITPLDGTDGQPDMVIPGLNSADDMTPQGMTYYPAKNQVLISSYMGSNKKHSNNTSVIYVLDFETGNYVAKINLYNVDGSAFKGHAGGIAVSDNNLYVATSNSGISYIPLSELENIKEGEEVNLTFSDTCCISASNNDTETSYLSFADGILWTGNFYQPKHESYGKSANDEFASLILGYKIDSCKTSAEEWDCLVSASDSGTQTPSFVITVPESIYDIQSVIVKNDKVFINTSWGRKNNSGFYVSNVDLTKPGEKALTLSNGNSVDAYSLTETKFFTQLPMAEGMFFKEDADGHNSIYNIFESAAYYYHGYDSGSLSVNPTDVVWKIDVDSLVNQSGETKVNCKCNCHKTGIISFFWKINLFFCKLLRIRKTCACGLAHY